MNGGARGSRHRSTGFGSFLIGAGMGLVTNLITDQPEKWPDPLDPIATYPPAIGATILAGVGAKAGWDVWRRRLPQPDWKGGNPYPGLTPCPKISSVVRNVATRSIGETGLPYELGTNSPLA